MDDHFLGGLDSAGALRGGGVLARQRGAAIPGGALAGAGPRVAVPAVWAGWWMLAQRPKPLPEEEAMEKQGKIHIVTEEVFL